MKCGKLLVIFVAVAAVPAGRADVLDGVIFGVKCAGAADRRACEEQSKREADQARERARQQPGGETPTTDATTGRSTTESRSDQVFRNWVQNVSCYTYQKRSTLDVDTVYASAMNRYGFMPRGQIKRLPGNEEGLLHVAGYLHEANPGALYRLEQVVHSADVSDATRQYKLLLDLARDGSGTRISGQYCVTTDDPGWEDLPAKIRSSLNSTFQ